MNIKAIKTKRIGSNDDIFAILDDHLPKLKEGSIVAITSKIVALCEGRVVPYEGEKQKDELIMREAEYYVPRSSSKYNVILTIKNGGVIFSSGIDESNTGGDLVLWPKDPQASVNRIREYLIKKHGIKDLGVVMTDTTSVPMRWGQRGVFALAHTGFKALRNYIGTEDLFGRKLKMTSAAISDPVATSAVLVMGEGNESTPLAVIENAPVEFQGRNPTKRELDKLLMPIEDDLFEPMLTAVKWRKGGMRKKVLLFGVFDAIHEGHKDILRQAKELAEEVVVAVARDSVAERIKRKPLNGQDKRMRSLKRESLVSRVVLGDGKLSSYGVVKEEEPDIICVGHDQRDLERDLKEWIKSHRKGVKVVRCEAYRPEEFSSSKLNKVF